MEFTPVPTRDAVRKVLKAQKAGETTVDITPEKAGEDPLVWLKTPDRLLTQAART